MSLITIFGINAAGKDAIVEKLIKEDSEIFATTESRLLMYHLGIVEKYGVDDPVTKEQYKRLENTPQPEILAVTNGVYRANLKSFKNADRLTVLLSHLVFMLHIDKDKPVFLDEKDPPYPELADGLVHIKSDPEDVLARRMKDNKDGTRERFHSNLELIKRHQALCNQKWEKITKNRKQGTFVTVINKNLAQAVQEVKDFLDQL